MRSRASKPGRKAILFVTHEHSTGDASLRYRSLYLAESLSLAGADCGVHRYGSGGLLEAMSDYACIVLHRVPWHAASPLLSRAAELGMLTLTNTDDLVFEPDATGFIEALGELDPEERRSWAEGYRRTIEASRGGAIVSTAPLAVHAGALTSRVEVVPNVIGEEMIRLAARARQDARSGNGVVTLGYLSGSPTHRRDFNEASEAVVWALETYEHVRFAAVGHVVLDSRFDPFRDRIVRVEWQPWQLLPGLQSELDINLAPLARDPFSSCKSCVKYLEAALAELPTVASPRSDFVRVIENGSNGLLADSPEEWREALGTLVESETLRRELGRNACEDVHERHTARACRPAIVHAFELLTAAHDGVARAFANRSEKARARQDLSERFTALGPWQSRFVIDGLPLGGDLDYSEDQRVPTFFGWFGAPRTILELSSFEGAHSLQLAGPRTTERVLGLEGRDDNIARARFVVELLGRGNVEFAREDLETVELARHGPFEAAFCAGLIYHLQAPWRLIREIAGVTDRLFLDTHYWDGEESERDGFRGGWYDEGGRSDPLSGLGRRSFWLTLPELMRALTDAGWAIRHIMHFSEWGPGPRVWLGCVRHGAAARRS
jgi:hypothetical protein